MGLSLTYRVLLAGILPVVALLLYLEGQHYDPALIQFQSSAPGEKTPAGFFPPEIDGFTLIGRIREYTKDTLYEYVNGHAEYFISSGFMTLSVGEYRKATSDSIEPDVTVDVYDMGRSIHAFGVLTDESGGNLSDLTESITGVRSPLGLSFSRGQYYIKITSYDESIPLETFLSDVVSRVAGASDPFSVSTLLPHVGEAGKTRFIKEAYRGPDFVNNVIEREYYIDGKTLVIFTISGEEEEMRATTEAFIRYFRDAEIPYSEQERKGKKVYMIKDRYEGDWVLIPGSGSVAGIYGSYDDRIIDAVLDESYKRPDRKGD